MIKLSAFKPRDRRFESCIGPDHDSSYGISTDWFQEAESKVIFVSCENLFHNRVKINMFKLN